MTRTPLSFKVIVALSIIIIFMVPTSINNFNANETLGARFVRDNTITLDSGDEFTSLISPIKAEWIKPLVECLIITINSLSNAFQPLADLKTSRGVNTKILTVEEIEANTTFTSQGADTAAHIRNAIKYYHDHDETEFVILGGDVGVIPIRYVFNPDTTEQYFYNGQYYQNLKPTDQYYAGLNGTWDADGDGKYGEMRDGTNNQKDEVDWTAEVFVGRLPVHNTTDTTSIVNKIINYELNPPAGNWYNNAVFAGAVSQFADPIHNKPNVDEAELSEFIIDNYIWNYNVTRLYYCSNNYTCPSNYTTLGTISLRNTINQGASILNLAGHGDPASYGGYESITSFQRYLSAIGSKTLSNTGKEPLTYIYTCSSGAFDLEEIGSSIPQGSDGDSLAEELIMNPNGGSIAVVSAMRTTYYFENDYNLETLNRGQDRFFWREFLVKEQFQPGKTLYLSKESYIKQVIDKYWNVDLNYDPELASKPEYLKYQQEFRKNLLTYNLLGDPEISIYTSIPRTFSLESIPNTMFVGDVQFVTIKDKQGNPVPGAKILINNSKYYVTTSANQLGVASLEIPFDQDLINQNMTITLSAHDMLRTSRNITILNDTTPPASFLASISSYSIKPGSSLTINATGVDAGSGIKHAAVIFFGDDGNITKIEPMKLLEIHGNVTSFTCKYNENMTSGMKLKFIVAGMDSGGSVVIFTPLGEDYFQVDVHSSTLEIVLTYTMGIGIPIVAVIIIAWLIYTMKKQKREV
ncbi:MAG: C25 family cysteine peptidase [Promethearchaeota archaeon]